jgi:U3 small nucleolar RNA-associated protein 4
VDTLTFTLRHPENPGSGDVPTLNDLRLFSTGGGSELLEWDLSKGCIRVSILAYMHLEPVRLTRFTKRTINSNGGAIWSVSPNPKSTIIALGCEDGTVQLLSTENDGLSHLRKLGKVKTRLLSIAWGPPILRDSRSHAGIIPESDDSSDDENYDDWQDDWLVTGCADSSIRKWDFATGRVTNRLTTDKTRGERTLVWSVCVLGCVGCTLWVHRDEA